MHFSGNTGRPIAVVERNLRGEKLDLLETGLILKLNALDDELARETADGGLTK